MLSEVWLNNARIMVPEVLAREVRSEAAKHGLTPAYFIARLMVLWHGNSPKTKVIALRFALEKEAKKK